MTVQDVGNVLLYVAPGFFGRIAYAYRFPQPQPQEFYATVVSIAASVPIVAVGSAVADSFGWPKQATDVRFVLLLLGLGLLAGYILSLARGSRIGRATLHELGLPFAPEATVYEQTVMELGIESEVTVTFKDGRIVSGYPTVGPAVQPEGQPRELYLSRPRWWSGGGWQGNDAWQGVIVSLDEVVSVALPEDPVRVHKRVVVPLIGRELRTAFELVALAPRAVWNGAIWARRAILGCFRD